MTYQRLQSKGSYADFTISDEDIDETFEAMTRIDDPWVLGVVNITNIAYRYASVADRGGQYGRWFHIPTVGMTCETNYDQCFGNGGWKPILVRPKPLSIFNIRIATAPNELGSATGTEFLEILPDGKFAGGVIGIS